MADSPQPTVLQYRTDFLTIVIAPAQQADAYLFCSGINMAKFTDLCRGTHGIGSNPAFKGLQLLRAEVTAFCRSRGATPVAGEAPCSPWSPQGHGWYHESLIVQNVPAGLPDELLRFSVMTLLRLVLSVCRPQANLPEAMPSPEDLPAYLASL